MTSRTCLCITLSDNFKLCESIIRMTKKFLVMYITLPAITQINSNTTGVSDACIKTSQLCCRRLILPSATCTRVRIYNPTRWTADTWRRCCCRTEHGLRVIWTRSTYRQLITVLFPTNLHCASAKNLIASDFLFIAFALGLPLLCNRLVQFLKKNHEVA